MPAQLSARSAATIGLLLKKLLCNIMAIARTCEPTTRADQAMYDEQDQIPSATVSETESLCEPKSSTDVSTCTIIELSRGEMEQVAAARAGGMKVIIREDIEN